jgi:hypothetical protein
MMAGRPIGQYRSQDAGVFRSVPAHEDASGFYSVPVHNQDASGFRGVPKEGRVGIGRNEDPD